MTNNSLTVKAGLARSKIKFAYKATHTRQIFYLLDLLKILRASRVWVAKALDFGCGLRLRCQAFDTSGTSLPFLSDNKLIRRIASLLFLPVLIIRTGPEPVKMGRVRLKKACQLKKDKINGLKTF